MAVPLPDISEVAPGIFIGNVQCTFKEKTYIDNNIQAVVSLTTDCYNAGLWKRAMFNRYIRSGRHLWIQSQDSKLQNLIQHMPRIVAFMHDMVKQLSTPRQPSEKPPAILVHCEVGRSRSAAALIAYLMALRNQADAAEILQQIQQFRKVQPNPGFMEQLHVWGAVNFDLTEADGKPKQAYAQWEALWKVALKAKGLTGQESLDREVII